MEFRIAKAIFKQLTKTNCNELKAIRVRFEFVPVRCFL